MFEPIIGIEIHVRLATKSKMFCACPNPALGDPPNSRTCPVCLGLPGALPVINKRAIEYAISVGLALNCKIASESYFERKSYFYPDLPKGYQISQYRKPLAESGWLALNGRRVGIRRVHQEEDTAKLFHKKHCSLIDFNRSGAPLLEIVTEPDLRGAEETKLFLKKLQRILRYLEVSDADMEKGSMRLEANISVRSRGGGTEPPTLPDYRVEIKNLNSFRFVERALGYELARQKKALKAGEKLVQETRGYDEKTGKTLRRRWKEAAHDYRYFPEPDLPPLRITKELVGRIAGQLPELPERRMAKLIKQYKLSKDQAEKVVITRKKAEYFELLVREGLNPQRAANIVVNKPDLLKKPAKELVGRLRRARREAINDEEKLLEVVEKVISANQKGVTDYKSGKESALRFLIGQAMRETGGRANPRLLQELFKKRLASRSEISN